MTVIMRFLKDGVNSYICKCSAGYSGKFCELAPISHYLYQKISPCQAQICNHVSVCLFLTLLITLLIFLKVFRVLFRAPVSNRAMISRATV